MSSTAAPVYVVYSSLYIVYGCRLCRATDLRVLGDVLRHVQRVVAVRRRPQLSEAAGARSDTVLLRHGARRDGQRSAATSSQAMVQRKTV